MEFVLTHTDAVQSILVLCDGVPYEADATHPWWNEIVDLAIDDDPRVTDLFALNPAQEPSVEPDQESEESEGDLKELRTFFDQAGFPCCPDPDCKYCYGPRA